ncbi:hypothetical protein RYX36_008152 [Vicia faba]
MKVEASRNKEGVLLKTVEENNLPLEAIDVLPISQYDPLSQSTVLSSLQLIGLQIKVKQENVDLSQSLFSPLTPTDFGGLSVPSYEYHHTEIGLQYVFG